MSYTDEYGGLDAAPADWQSGQAGFQSDGTFVQSSAALPYNLPANTSGNPSVTSLSGIDVLKFGTGILQSVAQWDLGKSMLDYKRFEATAGGLYRQGIPVNGLRLGQAQASPNIGLILIVVVGALLLTRKGA